jgi:hypothetical protein
MAESLPVKWTREHLLVALNLYCKLPFGSFNASNAVVKEVAAKMGRSASSLVPDRTMRILSISWGQHDTVGWTLADRS